jgi:hypothetical protein
MTMISETIEAYGFTVKIRSDLTWFTVYDHNDLPAGTIMRPSRLHGTRHWSAYATDGTSVTERAIGPRTCIAALMRHRRENTNA